MFDIDLKNTQQAFIYKTSKELKLAHFLFKIMASPLLVTILSNFVINGLKLRLPFLKNIIKATIFKQFCANEDLNSSIQTVEKLYQYNVLSILDYSVEGKQNQTSFEKTKNEIIHILEQYNNHAAIPFTCIKITGIAPLNVLEKVSQNLQLTENEKQEYQNAQQRLQTICQKAFENNLPIFIDAEESWIQNAIDNMAEEMMMTYNKEKVIVLTTLQMYRHDRLNYLQKLIQKAKEHNFRLGLKIVRGAYLEKENERAIEKNYPTPIYPNKAATDNAYNQALEIIINHLDNIVLCAGTHNENSTLLLLKLLDQKSIAINDKRVYFSQLYGMSDHISFNLAKINANVVKYLPYGPVKDVIPYLIRRAEENTSIADQTNRELTLIKTEINRRKAS